MRKNSRDYPPSKGDDVVVNVAAGKVVTGIDFAVRKGVTIRGKVTDTQGRGVAKVSFYACQGASGASAISDVDGNFVVYGAREGEVVKFRNLKNQDSTYGIKWGEQKSWTVGKQGLDGVELVAYPYCTIEGTLLDSTRKPLGNVEVIAIEKISRGGLGTDGSRVSVSTDGAFVLDSLFEGTYALTAIGLAVDPTKQVELGEVRLDPGQHLKGLALAADPEPGSIGSGRLTISGRVLNADGNPQRDVTVQIRGLIGGYGYFDAGSTGTAEDGTFVLARLPEGSYTLSASHSNGSQARKENVNAGATGVELRLEPQFRCVVRGQVLGATDGKPRSDFEIGMEFYDRTRGMSRDTLRLKPDLDRMHDAEGRFSLPVSVYPPENYEAWVVARAEGTAETAVKLTPRQNQRRGGSRLEVEGRRKRTRHRGR